jgi:S1-C subfamily serine protease
MRRPGSAFLFLIVVPGLAVGAPASREPRLHPGAVPAEPSYVRRVQPSLVALRATADPAAPSSARLGRRRFGSAIVFDARGYAVTVGYIVMDAISVEARLRDGRTVPARVAGVDLESGLAVVKLDAPGPWMPATFGGSRDVTEGTLTGTVGIDEDDDLVYVTGSVRAIRRFSGFWEYMLDRALLVAPANASWAGGAVVDAAGQVIGIASLRLGEAPYVNLAIPVEQFLPVKDELIAVGRVVSRPARPWLGIYTLVTEQGIVVDGFSPAGPAASAGFRRGDRILSVNDVPVATQEEFYGELWRGRAGDIVRVGVEREHQVHVIAVRSIDRYDVVRPAVGR